MTEAAIKKRRPLSEGAKAHMRRARQPDYVSQAELIRREKKAKQQRATLRKLSLLFWRLPTTHANDKA